MSEKAPDKCNCTCHLPGHGVIGVCTACEYNHNQYDYGELKTKESAIEPIGICNCCIEAEKQIDQLTAEIDKCYIAIIRNG